MSSQSPVRPLLLKGALVIYPDQTPGARAGNVILFQYNPDTMRRTLSPPTGEKPKGGSESGTAREDVLRLAGPPVETITLSIDLRADEQLEDPDMNPVVAAFGLHPALASLEMIIYPWLEHRL